MPGVLGSQLCEERALAREVLGELLHHFIGLRQRGRTVILGDGLPELAEVVRDVRVTLEQHLCFPRERRR